MQPSYSDNSDSPDDSVHPSDTVTNDPIDLGTFFSTFNALFDLFDPNAGPFPRYLTHSEILAAAKPDIDELDSSE
jgi:hypothetical protein